jgi:hypothetical protein
MNVFVALLRLPLLLTQAAAGKVVAPVKSSAAAVRRPVTRGKDYYDGLREVERLMQTYLSQKVAENLTAAAPHVQEYALKGTLASLGAAMTFGTLAWTSFLLSLLVAWWLAPSHGDIVLEVNLDYRQLRPSSLVVLEGVDRGTYDAILQLLLPQTPTNEAQGMACLTMETQGRSRNEINITKCVMARYHSPLLQTLTTMYYALPLVRGSREPQEAQELLMLRDWRVNVPGSAVLITLSTPRMQIPACSLVLQPQIGFLADLLRNRPKLAVTLMTWLIFMVKSAGAVFLALLSLVYRRRLQHRAASEATASSDHTPDADRDSHPGESPLQAWLADIPRAPAGRPPAAAPISQAVAPGQADGSRPAPRRVDRPQAPISELSGDPGAGTQRADDVLPAAQTKTPHDAAATDPDPEGDATGPWDDPTVAPAVTPPLSLPPVPVPVSSTTRPPLPPASAAAPP